MSRDYVGEALRAAGVRVNIYGEKTPEPGPDDIDYRPEQHAKENDPFALDEPPAPMSLDEYGEPDATPDSSTIMAAESAAPIPRKKSLVAFPLVSFAHIKLNTERSGYLVKGLLPSTGLVVIWGPPKCYKSFWATDLALHIAFGWQYRGRRVQQAAVVYIALEGRHGIPRRIAAFKQHHNVEDADAPFHLMTTPLDLIKQGAAFLKDIEAQLKERGAATPGVVFIDTLNRSLVGSESKDEDMARYLFAATAIEERFKCLVVIVHHCGIDASRPRGHTSLSGAVEVQMRAERAGDLQSCVTLELAKDLPEGDEIASRLESIDLGIDEDGDPITSLIVLPAEATAAPRSVRDKGRGPSKGQRAIEAAIDETLDSNGKTITPRTGMPEVRAVKVNDVRPEFERRYVVAETDPAKVGHAKRMAFNRALDKLSPTKFGTGSAEGADWVWKI